MATTLTLVCPNHQEPDSHITTGITGEKWCGECGIPEHDFISLPTKAL